MIQLILFFLSFALYAADPNEELLRGAKTGNLGLVKWAVENKADIETKNSEGETALILSAWYGSPEVLEYLLKNGAYINSQDKEGYTPLSKAATLGVGRHYEIVEELISHCANLNLRTKEGLTAYMLAKINGHLELAEVIAKAGAIKDKFYSRDEASLEILNASRLNDLNRFIYSSYFKPDFDFSKENGISPIMYAARNGNKFILNLLIRKNAKIDLNDNEGKTALMYAARRGNKEILSILIDKGADVQAKDKNGYTATKWAELFNQKDIVEFLKALED